MISASWSCVLRWTNSNPL